MKCPVCASTDNSLWSTSVDVEYCTSDVEYRYLQCSCGVIFLENPPLDELSTIYPSTYYSYQAERKNLIFRVKHRLDVRKFRKFLSVLAKSQLSVLDVGGGNGEVCNAMRDADSRVVSTSIVDLDPNLETYHAGGPHKYICSRIEDFVSDTMFDVAILINLIEHVDDPRSVLVNIQRTMAPGGLLIIQTPNTDSLDAKIFRKSHWGGLHAPRHWVLFDQLSLEKLLNETGFSSVVVRNSQGAPFWAVSTIHWLQKLRISSPSSRPIPSRVSFTSLLFLFGVTEIIRARLGFKTSQMYVTARIVDKEP